jgi:protein ImuB
MFACIYIPDFPVEAVVRVEPLLRARAVAILEGKPPLVRVIALNEKARTLGLETGMTKLQAAVFAEDADPATKPPSRSSVGSPYSSTLAVLRQRSAAQESSTHYALLDVAHAFTPKVEDAAPDTLLLDLEGLERLHGSPAKMAGDLATRVAGISVEANVAIAVNPDAAMHAARGFAGTTVIPFGEEARRLGVLPVNILLQSYETSGAKKAAGKSLVREQGKMREQMLDTLERWGVRDFRMLGLLPEHALASRLGETGVKLRQLALGEGMRTLTLGEPPIQFEEAMELEYPVETIEALSFILNRLLEQLCVRLAARALATQELRLLLQLEKRVADEETKTIQESVEGCDHNKTLNSTFERTLQLPIAVRDAKVFLKLLQLELAANPPGAPVTRISIKAEPAPPRSAQRGLFLPITPEAEKLEITLARIMAIIGERRAGIARLLDSHHPDCFRIERFTVPANNEGASRSPTLRDTAPVAVRKLRPVCSLRVQVEEGRPAKLAAKEAGRKELQGKIVWSAGPWRSSGDWWEENSNADAECRSPWDREEWDVALIYKDRNPSDGGANRVALYRIYRDLATGRWFADASYD